jgi:transcriptional regulator with XRE-family HTH domain
MLRLTPMKLSNEEPANRILQQWLKTQRESKGLSLRDVGRIVDTHHSVIGKVEMGKRRIDLVEYLVYCQAMGFDAAKGIELVEKELS